MKLNPKEREIRDTLNPRAPAVLRAALAQEKKSERERQTWSAYRFLQTGKEEGDGFTRPSYGRKWNRDYNPAPYPEAIPRGEVRIEMFTGTGIGCIYGFFGSDMFLWTLAGWNLTNANAEVRRKRKW